VYGLIVADADLEPCEWGRYGTSVPGASSTWDGLSNTNALRGNDHPAAQAASDHDADGHVDWYLPSKRELQIAQANVSGLFQQGRYWTSTQYSEINAWAIDFEYGNVNNWNKNNEFRVRPFRKSDRVLLWIQALHSQIWCRHTLIAGATNATLTVRCVLNSTLKQTYQPCTSSCSMALIGQGDPFVL